MPIENQGQDTQVEIGLTKPHNIETKIATSSAKSDEEIRKAERKIQEDWFYLYHPAHKDI